MGVGEEVWVGGGYLGVSPSPYFSLSLFRAGEEGLNFSENYY